jgi:hypothetical protein
MIGANPPGGMVWDPQKSDELIKRYGELWAKDPQASARCPVRDSDVETLILSGNLDFTIPAENAKEDLLPHLPNGRQVVVSEMGHIGDLWEVRPKATRRILASFLDTGVPDDSLYRRTSRWISACVGDTRRRPS